MLKAVLLMVLLVLGCMGDEAGPTVTTTTSPPITLGDSISVARGILEAEERFTEGICRKIKLNNTENIDCPSCHTISFTYECENPLDGKSSLYLAEVTVREGVSGDYVEELLRETCIVDSDCLPDSEYEYVCVAGECVRQSQKNEATYFCMSMGHNIRFEVLPNRISYPVCVFVNGNECEAWAYFFGRCGPDTGNMTDCAGFSSGEICTTEYIPVCAKIQDLHNLTNMWWADYTNPCLACTSHTRTTTPLGYLLGECPKTTSTTLSPIYDNAPRDYCEQQGYVYRIRTYATGREYGVCVFGIDDECDAQEFFHGRCTPQRG
jgi:putative hemolysin